MQKDDRPVILVTNDDGITAPGIRNLVEAVRDLGRVVVVAPDKPQSGMGHAITIGEPLRLEKVNEFDDIESWQCSGTPVDCVKLAKDKILHRKPDICLSGINHGPNHSINIIYSGTMSAAMEAAIEGIPSVGFSLYEFGFDADFTVSKHLAHTITKRMLEERLPEHTLLNVNIPKAKPDEFKGIKICRQAYAKWAEEFDERLDIEALKNGYASIVPIKIDFTDMAAKQMLEEKWKDLL